MISRSLPGSYDPTNNGTDDPTDAFVVKLNAAGTAVLYATYLGGADAGRGQGHRGQRQPGVRGRRNRVRRIFPARRERWRRVTSLSWPLTPTGTDVRYVSRTVAAGIDIGYGIAVEGTDAYVVGSTSSTDLPGAATAPAVSARTWWSPSSTHSGAPVYTTCLGGSDYRSGLRHRRAQRRSLRDGRQLVATPERSPTGP